MTRRTPEQYDWERVLFDDQRLKKHYTSPRRNKIQFIVIHHMTVKGNGKGSSLDACYNIWQTRQASAHYGVENNLVRQYVSDNDAAWATANATGNHAGISIEHANSTLGPNWEVADQTWKTGAKLVAYLHKAYGLGRPVAGKTLRRHKDFFATACPGPYLGTKIWAAYVAEAQRIYDSIVKTPTKPVTPTVPVKPTPAKTMYSSSAFLQNCASKRSDVGTGKWSKRRQYIANEILASDASFILCQELYNAQRPWITLAIKSKYEYAGHKDGRVIYFRKGRWTTPKGFISKYLQKNNTKVAIADQFTNVANGSKIDVVNVHLSYETNRAGSVARQYETKNLIAWMRGSKITQFLGGDWNTPADRNGRADDVEPQLEVAGYIDLEDTLEQYNGPGGYRLDRGFMKKGARATKIKIIKHKGSDHPGTFIQFEYPKV